MAVTPAGVDLVAATARRIPVIRVPPFVTEATADLNWALLLAVARRVVEGDRVSAPASFPVANRCISWGVKLTEKR